MAGVKRKASPIRGAAQLRAIVGVGSSRLESRAGGAWKRETEGSTAGDGQVFMLLLYGGRSIAESRSRERREVDGRREKQQQQQRLKQKMEREDACDGGIKDGIWEGRVDTPGDAAAGKRNSGPFPFSPASIHASPPTIRLPRTRLSAAKLDRRTGHVISESGMDAFIQRDAVTWFADKCLKVQPGKNRKRLDDGFGFRIWLEMVVLAGSIPNPCPDPIIALRLQCSL
ncbi:hypothetical protein CCMA1212_001042 [Trichoderma ghanense]|uniref:Uncharacterized protein n=1 Tax=Trichoderma ghanense TaxID=65468 RepID=A0ABY2HKM4_9HYPO